MRSAKRAPLPLLMCLAAISFGACSQSAQNQQSAESSPSPTPIPPNPSELSSLVWRFYHDQDQSTNKATEPGAEKDITLIASQPFLKSHASTLVRDYGYIANPDVTITNVRGNAIDYMVTYDYLAKNGIKLHWKRSGTWVAEHGASRWQLNEDKWHSIHIVSVTYPNGISYDVKDRVYTDGRHVFDVTGLEVTFTPTSDGWKTSVIALATPTPAPVTDTLPPDNPYAGSARQGVGVAPASDCDEDTIETVGDDGAILEMLSGAVYRVADYDTSTSSVWLSTEDVLICGSRIVNKDDSGEAVEAQRVR